MTKNTEISRYFVRNRLFCLQKMTAFHNPVTYRKNLAFFCIIFVSSREFLPSRAVLFAPPRRGALWMLFGMLHIASDDLVSPRMISYRFVSLRIPHCSRLSARMPSKPERAKKDAPEVPPERLFQRIFLSGAPGGRMCCSIEGSVSSKGKG